MKVFRQGQKITLENLQEIASALRQVRGASNRLLSLLNGRVLVRWLDPLCTTGRAVKFFEELRSALDDEEAKRFDTITLFYGWGPKCDCRSGATWLTWNETQGEISDLKILCQQCLVGAGQNRQRELRHFESMQLPDLVEFLRGYRWSSGSMEKIIRLWTEGYL